jgi:hypothetical protein
MRNVRLTTSIGVLAAAAVVAAIATQRTPLAQSAAPNMTGAWAPMQGGRGADPKTTPPPATPLVLKTEYRA